MSALIKEVFTHRLQAIETGIQNLEGKIKAHKANLKVDQDALAQHKAARDELNRYLDSVPGEQS